MLSREIMASHDDLVSQSFVTVFAQNLADKTHFACLYTADAHRKQGVGTNMASIVSFQSFVSFYPITGECSGFAVPHCKGKMERVAAP